MTLEDCQIKCAKLQSCEFWIYHSYSKKCYLKSQKHKSAGSTGVISGVKRCPTKENDTSQLSRQFKLFVHGHALPFLPATFGKQMQPTMNQVSSLTY